MQGPWPFVELGCKPARPGNLTRPVANPHGGLSIALLLRLGTPQLNHNSKLDLPKQDTPFVFIYISYHIRFVLNQIWLTLIKL